MRIRSRALIALLATVALLAFMAAPAFAHHRDDHDGGNAESAESETTEETTTEEEASDERAGKSRSTQTDDGSTEASSTERTTTQREPQPDPSPSQAPPKTTGPSCQDYSDQEGGTYDHDYCDDSQGMHGSGGNGKCAGCTGKADDKGPGGQSRNDHNNGYECDNNGGVGKGNPAHARCPKTPPPVAPEQNLCPAGTDLAGMPPGQQGCNLPPKALCPPGSDREGLPPNANGCNEKVRGRIDLVCPPGSAQAGRIVDNLENCVLGTRIINPGTPPLGNVTRQEPAAVLPMTGSSGVTPIAILGMLLILLGALGMRAQRS